MLCFFVSDLHGKISRYKSLFKEIKNNKPALVFIGGDLLSLHDYYFQNNMPEIQNLFTDFIIPNFAELKSRMGPEYPQIYLILGNDDLKINENIILEIK